MRINQQVFDLRKLNDSLPTSPLFETLIDRAIADEKKNEDGISVIDEIGAPSVRT